MKSYALQLYGVTLVALFIIAQPARALPETLAPTRPQAAGKPITAVRALRDALLFNGLYTGVGFLPYEVIRPFGGAAVGVTIRHEGSLARALQEALLPHRWQWTEPPAFTIHRTEKSQRLLVAHPLIGYSFASYLLNSGYTRRQALATSALAFYIQEKAIQGSFETPSILDYAAYLAGTALSLAVEPLSLRLREAQSPLLRPAAYVLNPLLLLQRPSQRRS